MIVPGGNGGDTRLSVPFPARAAAAVASPARPPAAPNAAPSRAIIALCNKERDAGSKKGRRCPLSSCYIFLLPPLLYSPVIGPILPPPPPFFFLFLLRFSKRFSSQFFLRLFFKSEEERRNRIVICSHLSLPFPSFLNNLLFSLFL